MEAPRNVALLDMYATNELPAVWWLVLYVKYSTMGNSEQGQTCARATRSIKLSLNI
jgi:hypothetical protein